MNRRKLKQRRAKLGLTQWQVAAKLGIVRSAYANLENGYRRITRDRKRQIDKVLRI